jgi:predicted small secreted protein
MRKILILAAMVSLTALAGCGTVDGIGRDISGGANRVAGWLG